MLTEIDEDEWPVGTPVAVTPLMVTIGGERQEVLLVSRDPEGPGRVSAVKYRAEMPVIRKASPDALMTFYRMP